LGPTGCPTRPRALVSTVVEEEEEVEREAWREE